MVIKITPLFSQPDQNFVSSQAIYFMHDLMKRFLTCLCLPPLALYVHLGIIASAESYCHAMASTQLFLSIILFFYPL